MSQLTGDAADVFSKTQLNGCAMSWYDSRHTDRSFSTVLIWSLDKFWLESNKIYRKQEHGTASKRIHTDCQQFLFDLGARTASKRKHRSRTNLVLTRKLGNESYLGLSHLLSSWIRQHFNSASHSMDDIMVCGFKQCSGGHIKCKQHEIKLIFKLGTLRPNESHGLNINFNFLWLCFQRVLHIHTRAKTMVFICCSTPLFTSYFVRALSVRTCTYSSLYAWLAHFIWTRA